MPVETKEEQLEKIDREIEEAEDLLAWLQRCREYIIESEPQSEESTQ